MSKDLSQHYDKLYSEQDSPFGGGEPLSVVKKIPDYMESGKVLDVGAGDGRNTIYLASHGFDIEAFDISKKGIKKIQEKAKKKRLPVDAYVKDVTDISLKERYSAVVMSFLFHHLKEEVVKEFIKKAKTNTKKGGVHAVGALTKDGDFYCENPQTEKYYPEKGELRELYSDWEILEYIEKEEKAHRTYPDGSPMFNIAAKLLARKQSQI